MLFRSRFNFTPTHTDSKLTVCSGLDNTCHTLNTQVDLGVTLHKELLNNNDTFDISPAILKETPVDIIIGRDTIKKYKLFEKIPSQLSIDGLNHDDLEVGVGVQSVSLLGLSEMVSQNLQLADMHINLSRLRLLSHHGLNHQYLTGSEFFQKAYTF